MKSGNINFLEPSGPLQACNGAAFIWLICICKLIVWVWRVCPYGHLPRPSLCVYEYSRMECFHTFTDLYKCCCFWVDFCFLCGNSLIPLTRKHYFCDIFISSTCSQFPASDAYFYYVGVSLFQYKELVNQIMDVKKYHLNSSMVWIFVPTDVTVPLLDKSRNVPYFPARKTHFFSRKMWPKFDLRLMRQG
jgi:hypothetical protein